MGKTGMKKGVTDWGEDEKWKSCRSIKKRIGEGVVRRERKEEGGKRVDELWMGKGGEGEKKKGESEGN